MPRIAVVEDNSADVYLIRQALHQRGIDELTVLRDGEAGLDFVIAVDSGRMVAPDLVILDLSLPRRNGAELLERIKASKACAGVKVIIASSSRSPSDRSIASRFGADYYFVKPSNFDEYMRIGAMVQDLLSAHPH